MRKKKLKDERLRQTQKASEALFLKRQKPKDGPSCVSVPSLVHLDIAQQTYLDRGLSLPLTATPYSSEDLPNMPDSLSSEVDELCDGVVEYDYHTPRSASSSDVKSPSPKRARVSATGSVDESAVTQEPAESPGAIAK